MKSSKKPFWQRVIDPQAISVVKFIHSLDHGLIPCVLARNILGGTASLYQYRLLCADS